METRLSLKIVSILTISTNCFTAGEIVIPGCDIWILECLGNRCVVVQHYKMTGTAESETEHLGHKNRYDKNIKNSRKRERRVYYVLSHSGNKSWSILKSL